VRGSRFLADAESDELIISLDEIEKLTDNKIVFLEIAILVVATFLI
jgi:hypothetical protein